MRDKRLHAELLAGCLPVYAARVIDPGPLLQFLQRVRAGVEDGRTHRRGGRAAAARAGRRELRVADAHCDLFGLQPEHFRRDDRDQRARAGAEVLRAATHLNAGVGIDLRLGLRAVSAAAPRRAGATDAGLDGARGTSRRLVLLFPAKFLNTDAVFALPDFARIVLQANLDRVHLQFHGEFIEDRFHAERGDRMAWRSEGAALAGVHRHVRLLHASVGDAIYIWSREARAAATARGRGAGAGARRAVRLHLKRHQLAVGGRAEFDFLERRWAIADGERLIEAGQHQPDRRAGEFRQLRREAAFDARPKLRAKPATHVLGDDVHLFLRHVEVRRESVAHAEHALRRRPTGDAVVGHGNRVAVSFERVMDLDWRGEKSFDDCRRVGERLIHVAPFPHVRFAQVRCVRPDARGVRLLRDFLLHNEWLWRGFDFDHTQRVEARLLARAGDGGEFFTVESDRPLAFAHSHDRFDAGNLSCLIEIDAGHLRGRPTRPVDHPMQPARRLNVGGVFGCARHLRGGFDARRPLVDDVRVFRPASHGEPPSMPPQARAVACRTGRDCRSTPRELRRRWGGGSASATRSRS